MCKVVTVRKLHSYIPRNVYCITWSIRSLLTFIPSVSAFVTTFVSFLKKKSCHFHQSSQSLEQWTSMAWGVQVTEVSDSPSGLVSRERQKVPTTSPAWPSTHHYIKHGAFSNDYYQCGTSGFGKTRNGSRSGPLLSKRPNSFSHAYYTVFTSVTIPFFFLTGWNIGYTIWHFNYLFWF